MTEVIPFIGVNQRTGQEINVPDHFLSRHGDELRETRNTFSDVIHNLPRAYSTEVAYHDERSGDWMEVSEGHRAIYDPEKSADENPVWSIVSDQYTIVNPGQFYGPLETALMDEEVTDVFGTVTTQNRGGEGFVNLMFADSTDVPDEASNALYTGIRSGYSHISSMPCWAEGFAQDGRCSNSMYSLTDRKERRHVGDAMTEVTDWWDDVLASYGAINDFLGEMIRNALEFEIDITDDLPFEQWNEFYELLDFSEAMARQAQGHALNRSDSPVVLNAWELHSGATFAITHSFTGKQDSDRHQEYVQAANDILQNPAMVMDQIQVEYERRLQAIEGEESDEYSEEGLELLEEQSASIEDLKAEYEDTQEEMQQLLVVGDDSENAEVAQ